MTKKSATKSDFTTRVLMSLVSDMNELSQAAERVSVQINTLAKEKGIQPPPFDHQ